MLRSCDLSSTLPFNMAAASVFHRVRTGSKIGAQYDQEGNLIQVKSILLTFLTPRPDF